MNLEKTASQNLERLRMNNYPGRGIILGASPDGRCLAQVYWIMGRSENSRNRIFVMNPDGSIRTKAFDEAKLRDPSLIIYFPARHLKNAHIVTNGDQTDTIFQALERGESVESALRTRVFEPDAPNYTPRISGVSRLGGAPVHALSILKTIAGNPDAPQRQFFEYDAATPGYGHCITTYSGDGDPLPSFEGEPCVLPVGATAEETAQRYWAALNADNRVALFAKFIECASGKTDVKIINRHA